MSEVDRRALRGRLGVLWQQAFRRRRGAPSLFGVMVSAFTITQERMTRSRLAGDPPDLTVAPRLGHVGLLEFERAAEMIAEGEAATERVMAEIHTALELLG
jgi:NTE family protein